MLKATNDAEKNYGNTEKMRKPLIEML